MLLLTTQVPNVSINDDLFVVSLLVFVITIGVGLFSYVAQWGVEFCNVNNDFKWSGPCGNIWLSLWIFSMVILLAGFATGSVLFVVFEIDAIA